MRPARVRRCRGARLGCRRRLTLEKAPLPKPQFNQDGTPLEYARLNESSYYDAVKSIDHRDDDVTNTARRIAAALTRRSEAKNYNAGPAHVPTETMLQLCLDMLDYGDTGLGIQEMSHRDPGGAVQQCMVATCDMIRTLLKVPDNYEILIMQGGAHQQFSAVPMNLLRGGDKADYVDGGFWSRRCCDEAKKFCDAQLVPACIKNDKGEFDYIPPSEWKLRPDASYVHICANETISGLEFLEDPDLPMQDTRPLVGDFTSTLLSRPIDVAKYGCIYASGGKNLGPAGVGIVIVRKDLLNQAHPMCPSMMSYTVFANTSPIPNLYNTPPLQTIRGIQLTIRDTAVKNGGLAWAEARAKRISGMLYKIVEDSNGFYTRVAAEGYASRMTIPFLIRGGDKELEALFVKKAEEQKMYQTFGHISVGGLRACFYNSLPDSAVESFFAFMEEFRSKYDV